MNWKFAQILLVMFFMGTYFGSMISISLPDKRPKNVSWVAVTGVSEDYFFEVEIFPDSRM